MEKTTRSYEDDEPSARAEDVLRRFPGPVTLQGTRGKWVAILLACLFFGMAAILAAANGNWLAGLSLPVLGFGFVVTALNLIPGVSALTLDKDGFKINRVFSRHMVSWRNVSEFTDYKHRVPKGMFHLVVYDEIDVNGRRIDRAPNGSGRNSEFNDNYGLSAPELAKLMNQWREHAGQRCLR